MNDTQREKLRRFGNDVVMSEAVKNVVRDAFLKGKGQRDVQVLAAERLALDFLEDAWKELKRYADTENEQSNAIKQVGL